MKYRACAVAVGLLVALCCGTGARAEAPGEAGRAATATTYLVKRGDSLWSIARRLLGSGARHTLIQRLNPAVNPKKLRVGATLRIPSDPGRRLVRRSSAPLPGRSRTNALAKRAPEPMPERLRPAPASVTTTEGLPPLGPAAPVALPVEILSITPGGASIGSGGVQQFTASLLDGNGKSAPPGAALRWASSDPAVAVVDGRGLATALAPGVTTITATAGPLSATATVLVTGPPVRIATLSIRDPYVSALRIGRTTQLAAVAFDEKGRELPSLPTRWRTGNPSVATVNAEGVLTAISAGIVTVTAEVAGVTTEMATNVAGP